MTRALSRFPARLAAARARAGRLIGDHCRKEAKANAPRSPTKKQHSKTLVRKRVTAVRGHTPGGLEKSIRYEILPNGDVSVFVPSNGFTRTKSGYNYAKRIHDEKGVTWFKRGAGTVAKGSRADEKFIERAVNDNAQKYLLVYEQEIKREIARL